MSQARPTDLEANTYAQEFTLGEMKGEMSAAFRKAFPKSNGSDKTINEKASRFHKTDKVRASLGKVEAETRQVCADKHGVTLDSIIKELEEARALGLANAQASACVAASMAKAKLSGLDIERIEISGADMSPWASIGKAD